MPAALRIDQLDVRFAGHQDPVVAAFTLDVAPGEVVALLGPSGCGKTTVLRCVAGLQTPTTGRIVLDGVDVTTRPPHTRGVGLMFQDYALFPHRNVGDNVAFGLRMQRQPAAARRRRVAEVLELVGLAGWEQRAVGPLSGGEQQRVALARALAPAPGVLLLDEPLGALDRSLRDRLLPEMGELFRHLGTTVVHVTHDQAEALGMADRVVVMEQGRIAQVGAPAEVWSRPASAEVARFLGFTNVTERQLVRPDAIHLHRHGAATAPGRHGRGADRAAPGGRDTGSNGLESEGEAQGTSVGETLGESVATVESVVFKGERAEVRVRLADGDVLDASVATGIALGRGLGLPEVGETVGVTIDPAGIVAFP